MILIPYSFFIATTGILFQNVEGCFALIFYPLTLRVIPLTAYTWGYQSVEFFGIPLQSPPIDGVWYPEAGMVFFALMAMQYLASIVGWLIGILLTRNTTLTL